MNNQTVSMESLGTALSETITKALQDAEKNASKSFKKSAHDALTMAKTILEFTAPVRTGRLKAGYEIIQLSEYEFMLQNTAAGHAYVSNLKDKKGFHHMGGKFIAGSDIYQQVLEIIQQSMEGVSIE